MSTNPNNEQEEVTPEETPEDAESTESTEEESSTEDESTESTEDAESSPKEDVHWSVRLLQSEALMSEFTAKIMAAAPKCAAHKNRVMFETMIIPDMVQKHAEAEGLHLNIRAHFGTIATVLAESLTWADSVNVSECFPDVKEFRVTPKQTVGEYIARVSAHLAECAAVRQALADDRKLAIAPNDKEYAGWVEERKELGVNYGMLVGMWGNFGFADELPAVLATLPAVPSQKSSKSSDSAAAKGNKKERRIQFYVLKVTPKPPNYKGEHRMPKGGTLAQISFQFYGLGFGADDLKAALESAAAAKGETLSLTTPHPEYLRVTWDAKGITTDIRWDVNDRWKDEDEDAESTDEDAESESTEPTESEDEESEDESTEDEEESEEKE